MKVSEIMTPRVVVTIADEEMTFNNFLKNKEFLHFSRIPVFKDNRDNITAYIFRQDVYEKLVQKDRDELRLKDIKRDIIVVQNILPLFKVWEKLMKEKEHIALVVNEYGVMDGIVTMEDIIETLIGVEIIDEKDFITDMQQYAREKWNDKGKIKE